jgi:tripartite motif-containing protein 71
MNHHRTTEWALSELARALAVTSLAGGAAIAAEPILQSYIAPNAESYVSVGSFGTEGNLNDEFAAPEGAAFDKTGNIWVADTNNNRVTKFDAAGTFLLSFGAYGNSDGLFNRPKDVAIDKDGNLWVADTGNNRIQKFDAAGNWRCTLTGLSQPRGIGTHPVSALAYVANTNANNVVKVDLRNCSNSGAWGSPGAQDGQLSSPGDVAVDAAGQIYVADSSNNRIQVFNNAGRFLRKWGVYGSGDSRFQPLSSSVPPFPQPHFYGPANVAIDGCGDIYVSDLNNDRIQLFRPDGSFVSAWGWKGAGAGQLNSPAALAVDYLGRVLVADRDNHRMQLFQPSNSDRTHLFSLKWGASGTGDGLFNNPDGVAVDPANGEVFVADTANQRIQVFDSSGIFQRKWGAFGTGAGQFNQPAAIAVNPVRNEVYVVEYGNSRVQVFTKQGAPLRSWGGSGTSNGQFKNPRGIAVDAANDRLYVADYGNSRILVFVASTGAFAFGIANGAVWNGDLPVPAYGPGNRWFNGVWGVAVDEAAHALYAVEYSNRRVQKLSQTGAFIGAWGGPGFGSGQFNYPTGIAVDGEHNVYVVEQGSSSRIQKFTSAGRFITRWSSFGSNDGLLSSPVGLGINTATGLIYVSEEGNDRVQRFRPFGLSLGVAPATVSIKQDAIASYGLSVKGIGPNVGSAQQAGLCLVSGKPSPATLSFTPPSLAVKGGQTKAGKMTLNTAPTTPARSYQLTVLTRGGGQTRTKSVILNVTK